MKMSAIPFGTTDVDTLLSRPDVQIVDLAVHAKRDVRLVVGGARDQRDEVPGNNLAQEGHPTPQLTMHLSANVEPQIHFFEVLMERHATTQHTRAQEAKANKAQECATVVRIEFRSTGHEWS